ncbi:MAG TPA: spherulation-specific family 4 protein [Streptosporangiaceae bacterium]|nr:spherulation-specific family 4 protein [Streptosporangiaceae bacterium]
MQRSAVGAELTTPQLLVPAYFHPASHPNEWAWLASQAAQVRFIVLNVANGPGPQPDTAFTPALERLRSAGVDVGGYVDTNYGHRPVPDILADISLYLEWYQVTGVFFDRVAVIPEHVGHYGDLAAQARDLGAQVVAFNHGAHPVEAYAEHADLLGTFEGPWTAYPDLAVPRWTRSRPADLFFHLVHSVPRQSFDDAYLLAARRNAGCAYVTDRGGANPWDGLPSGQLQPGVR